MDTGVGQGDRLSSILFNIAREEALYIVKNSRREIKKGVNMLAFADDVSILAHTEEYFKDIA